MSENKFSTRTAIVLHEGKDVLESHLIFQKIINLHVSSRIFVFILKSSIDFNKMVEKCLVKTQVYENKNSKRLSAHCVGTGQGSFEKV